MRQGIPKEKLPPGSLLFGAGYGSRTRLHGLGSRCITDIRTLRMCGYYSKAYTKIQPLFVEMEYEQIPIYRAEQ